MRYTNNKFRLIFGILILQCSAKEQTGNHLATSIPLTTTISDYGDYYEYDQPSDCECSNSTLYIQSVDLGVNTTLVPTNDSSVWPLLLAS